MMKKTLLLFIFLITSSSFAKTPVYKNRHYIKNKLIEVFGVESKAVILKSFFFATNDLGGPCDIYSQVYNNEKSVLDPFTKCPGGKAGSKISMYGKDSPLRSAALLKTCHKLSSSFNQPQKVVDPVKQAYESFYPFDLRPKLKLKVDKELGALNLKPQEKLRKSLFTFCLSPGWQEI